ncbi:MAG TPA: gamma-glutamylcyclotransferase family protein [Candidatus Binatia bacterium]|jgi:gamma-glutamylcyclotransferase (GGCT)/AIG2-like uncharacterized protein YtfP
MKRPGKKSSPETRPDRELLFVYGTLRRACNHRMHEVLRSHADFIGPGKFQGKLYDLGKFPGAVATRAISYQVQGEIYALEDAGRVFAALDAYEDQAFRREKVAVQSENGATILAWTYLYARPVNRLKIIASGDFLNRG